MVMCPQRCRALREMVIRGTEQLESATTGGNAGDATTMGLYSNFVEINADKTSLTIYLNDHKTANSHQPMVMRVSATGGNSSDSALFESVAIFVHRFRKFLVLPGVDDEGRFFLKQNGTGFSDAEFSHWISSSFMRDRGVKMSFNLLRSSFVTAMLSHGHASGDASVREGVAACMGSSETYQRQSYDRRRRQDVRKRGFEFAHAMRKELNGDGGGLARETDV